jgi:hypothetical protein
MSLITNFKGFYRSLLEHRPQGTKDFPYPPTPISEKPYIYNYKIFLNIGHYSHRL